MLLFLAGIVNVFRYAGPLIDVIPILAIWAFHADGGGPAGRRWRYLGRPVRGLVVPLVVLFLLQLTLLLIPNRPLPAEGWAASAIAVVAGYFLILVRSRIPDGRGGVRRGPAAHARRRQAEQQQARPQLDDRRIPRLRALGLGPAIDAWRARQSGGGGSPPELGDRPVVTTAHFSGMSPPPWAGPKGWAHALAVYADDDDEDEDDEDDEDEDAATRSDSVEP